MTRHKLIMKRLQSACLDLGIFLVVTSAPAFICLCCFFCSWVKLCFVSDAPLLKCFHLVSIQKFQTMTESTEHNTAVLFLRAEISLFSFKCKTCGHFFSHYPSKHFVVCICSSAQKDINLEPWLGSVAVLPAAPLTSALLSPLGSNLFFPPK